jgi:hypothetical protein
MMGTGFLNRAANKKANNCVLSPISASATTPVEISRVSIIAPHPKENGATRQNSSYTFGIIVDLCL